MQMCRYLVDINYLGGGGEQGNWSSWGVVDGGFVTGPLAHLFTYSFASQ